MSWEAWFTLGVIGACFAALSLSRVSSDIVMIGGLLALMLAGVLTPAEALGGLANEGMVTIGMLYIVTSALQETGAMSSILPTVLGRTSSLRVAQFRLMAPVAMLSALLNNTPLVAMLISAVNDWAKKNAISASKMMIPLSYAAIIGGTTTLIGTSTNLVVNGLLIKETDHPGLGMFDIAWVGIPCAIAVIGFVVLFSRWLLPDRISATAQFENARSYTIEMLVEEGSALVGKTVEQAGLRHLPGLYLMEVDRQGHTIPAVSPQERLCAHDRLIFTGVIESVVDLHKIKGLTPATDQIFHIDGDQHERNLVEAVVSDSCPLIGVSIREGRFRTLYNAAVIAVSRNGEQICQKIGDIVLAPGDTLLLMTTPAFSEQQRNSRDFYLVSNVENSTRPRHAKAGTALAILAGMVISVTAGWTSMLIAAMVAAALMLVTRCTSSRIARRNVDWQVLLTIAAAFGVGKALEITGAAAHIAEQLSVIGGGDPWMTLVVIYRLCRRARENFGTSKSQNNCARRQICLRQPGQSCVRHDTPLHGAP